MVHNTTSMMRLVNEGMREWGIALHGVGKTIDEAKENVVKCYGFPQTLYMSCGYRMTFHSEEKLPNQNIPCPCGNPNHWIVKYELIREPIYRRALNWVLRLFS